MKRLQVKWATAPQYLPAPIENTRDSKANIGLIHFGTSMESAREAIDVLVARGEKVNDLRVLAFPFHDQVAAFIEQHDQVFVVEQNRDAQLKSLLVNELQIDPSKLQSVLHFNGDPISAEDILSKIDLALGKASSANVA